MLWPIYYYIDGCGYCERVLPDIVALFVKRAIPLLIRKPTPVEKPDIPGYPALLLPGRDGPPILLVGSEIVRVLQERPELLDGRAFDCYGVTPAGNGDSGL